MKKRANTKTGRGEDKWRKKENNKDLCVFAEQVNLQASPLARQSVSQAEI